jgi:DNA-binding HxlR family transcriptional regulator
MPDGLDPPDEATVAGLVSQRYVVEVLDALTARPLTLPELRRILRARPRPLVSAVRSLAARGAVRRLGHHGSWDDRGSLTTRYALTGTGREIAGRLERIEVWDALYQRYVCGRESGAVETRHSCEGG